MASIPLHLKYVERAGVLGIRKMQVFTSPNFLAVTLRCTLASNTMGQSTRSTLPSNVNDLKFSLMSIEQARQDGICHVWLSNKFSALNIPALLFPSCVARTKHWLICLLWFEFLQVEQHSLLKSKTIFKAQLSEYTPGRPLSGKRQAVVVTAYQWAWKKGME